MSRQENTEQLVGAPVAIEAPSSRPAAVSGRSTIGSIISSTGLYLLMALIALLSIFPFLWMLSTSLKAQNQVMTTKIELIPDPFVFSNYTDVLTNPSVPFDLFFLKQLSERAKPARHPRWLFCCSFFLPA